MHADYALVEYNSVLKIPCCFCLNEKLPIDLPERRRTYIHSEMQRYSNNCLLQNRNEYRIILGRKINCIIGIS